MVTRLSPLCQTDWFSSTLKKKTCKPTSAWGKNSFWVIFILLSHSAFAQFTLLNSKHTGIHFTNKLTESESANVLAYEYFYNGGGVAVGDLNNDGLPDLFFTGNMVPDQLYLNQGNLTFKNITAKSRLNAGQGWKTGVTLVDINLDGWLDIYVCYSGNGEPETRRNKLYINNKNLTFSEKAAEYGLDLVTHSTQAVFFDYDKDGDQDCFVLNHNIKEFKRFDAELVKAMRDPNAGDQLLQNNNGKFVNVSAAAGIKANPIGFGLGVAIADVNQDGWPDIYVSNDYIEQDYLYINNGNGTFTDKLEESLGHVSFFSMGNEITDINNDGLPDILTVDMLPEDNQRQKLLYGPENYEVYQNMLENKFYHQLMRNMLQINNGDGTFSEVGQLAGISNTDWSWAPLVADWDNDGWKDIFITNGYLRDYTNMDFMKFYADKKMKEAQGSPTALMDILKEMPASATQNYIFRNNGGLKFENKGKAWGFDQTFLSNGAVYADLDLDGDLEIITNNVNTEASIYRNDARSGASNYLQVQLTKENPAKALGAKVWIYVNGKLQYQEFYPSRGFQSSMYTPLHFGLGKASLVDSVRVLWADNQQQVMYKVAANQKLVVDAQTTNNPYKPALRVKPLFAAIQDTLPYLHQEDEYNDFKRQLLMPNMLSYQGPRIAQADVNGDKLPDLYLAGAKGQAGTLLLQQKNGTWKPSAQPDIESDFMSEDTGVLFFDADQDKDLDLYVVSGGFAYLEKDLLLQDRLYLNDGAGNFTKVKTNLPFETSSDACVTAIDIDKDGDLDLFVGGRVIPGRYPEPASSRILINDGKGKFSDGTALHAAFLEKFGLVTDAVSLDVNKDGWNDLIIAGEWMPIQILINQKGVLQPANTTAINNNKYGWWNRLALEDLDKDGDLDIVVGNFGQNTQLKPTEQEPVTLVYSDFDQNGAIDPFVSYYIQGRSYPLVSRDEALNQIIPLRKKFTSYKSYANATLQDIFTPEQLNQAQTLKATDFSSVILENKGDGTFNWYELPTEAQMSPVFAIALLDVDHDGLKDLILGGNQSYTRLKIGKMDACYGTVLRNLGQCKFSYMPQWQSGLQVKGDVRDIAVLKKGNGTMLLFGRNNQSVKSYLLNTPGL